MTHGNSIKENRGEIIKKDYATSELQKDINEFPFSKFAHEHFQVRELFILKFHFEMISVFHICCFHYVHHFQITNNKHFDIFKEMLSDFDFDVGFLLFLPKSSSSSLSPPPPPSYTFPKSNDSYISG